MLPEVAGRGQHFQTQGTYMDCTLYALANFAYILSINNSLIHNSVLRCSYTVNLQAKIQARNYFSKTNTKFLLL